MVQTYKEKFNKKFGFPPGTSHSLAEISKLTGKSPSGIETIFRKGKGAFFTNPQSVRPHVKDPSHWGYSRVYSAVMGGKAAKIDKKELEK